MAKVLVTGGAGCIGSDLVECLLNRGDKVHVLDDLSSGKESHLAPFCDRSGFSWTEGDVLDRAVLDAVMDGAEVVYHLAANPDVKFREGEPTDKDLRQNTLATYEVLDSMRRHRVDRLVFASTSAVYGISECLPIAEEHPTRPISLYGASKLACEGLITAYQHLFGIQCWIFRFANIVGPKTRKRGGTVISDFVEKLQRDPRRLDILGDGRQAKSYLLSSECVEAMLFAVEHAHAPVNVFNLGCDDQLPVSRIAEMVCEAMGLRDVTYRYTDTAGGWPGDVPRFLLDVTAINRLGWKARCNSEQAVTGAIEAVLERQAVAG